MNLHSFANYQNTCLNFSFIEDQIRSGASLRTHPAAILSLIIAIKVPTRTQDCFDFYITLFYHYFTSLTRAPSSPLATVRMPSDSRFLDTKKGVDFESTPKERLRQMPEAMTGARFSSVAAEVGPVMMTHFQEVAGLADHPAAARFDRESIQRQHVQKFPDFRKQFQISGKRASVPLVAAFSPLQFSPPFT